MDIQNISDRSRVLPHYPRSQVKVSSLQQLRETPQGKSEPNTSHQGAMKILLKPVELQYADGILLYLRKKKSYSLECQGKYVTLS